MRTFTSLDEVADAIGTELGTSDWLEIDQDRIDRSPTRPATTSGSTSTRSARRPDPFGGTIAHGYLTLSLSPTSAARCSRSRPRAPSSTTGSTRSASPTRCRVGSRVRAHVSIGEVTDLPAGKQLLLGYTIEIEGEDKPACVAETVVLLLP